MIDVATGAFEALRFAVILGFVAFIVGVAIIAARPVARRLQRRGRKTADGVLAAAAVVALGLTVAILSWLLSGLGQAPDQMLLLNDSDDEQVVLEWTQGFSGVSEVDYRFVRSDPVRLRSTPEDGARCISREPQRLLRLNDGVELSFTTADAGNPSRSVPLDPADYEVVAELPADACFLGRTVWLSWDGVELRQVAEPEARGYVWIVLVTGGLALACVVVGIFSDRRSVRRSAAGVNAEAVRVAAGASWSTDPPTQPPLKS